MIYLAQPYTGTEPEMDDRFLAACAAVAHLTHKGQLVYSPIVHYHMVASMHELPRDFAFWQKMNLAMIDKADAFYYLRLPGWEESIGLRAEMNYATDRGLCCIPMEDVRRG